MGQFFSNCQNFFFHFISYIVFVSVLDRCSAFSPPLFSSSFRIFTKVESPTTIYCRKIISFGMPQRDDKKWKFDSQGYRILFYNGFKSFKWIFDWFFKWTENSQVCWFCKFILVTVYQSGAFPQYGSRTTLDNRLNLF